MKAVTILLDKLRLSEASTYAGLGLVYTLVQLPPEMITDANKMVAGLAGILAWIIKEKGSK